MRTWKLLMLALLGIVLFEVGCSAPPPSEQPRRPTTGDSVEHRAKALAPYSMAPVPRRPTTGDSVEHTVMCPTVEAVAAQQVVVILGDGGTQSQDDLAALVGYLEPATHLYLAEARGAGRGYMDALPPAPSPFECVIKNPYDRREREACERRQHRSQAQRGCLEAARQRIITALQGLTPARATSTEVEASLVAAAQIVAAYPSRPRWLVMYADLGNPGAPRVPHAVPGLEGVKVLVRLTHTTPDKTPQRLAAFTQPLLRWGALVTVVPVEVPWSVAVAMPPLTAGNDMPSTALAAFMASLEPGPYGVIVASPATEQAARAEMEQIEARYPELRPWSWRPPDGKYWAVCIGNTYTRTSAAALKNKAIELGLQPDAFLVTRRR